MASTKTKTETEVYREDEPWGSNVWTEFEHPMVPSGFAIQRVTTHRIICTRCRRYHHSWAVLKPEILDNLRCPNCD